MDETMGNSQVTAVDVGWMAGIIDGEGYLGLPQQHSKKGRCIKFEISVTNTDLDTVNRYVELLRKAGINPYIRARVHEKKTWKANVIVSVCKMADVKKLMDLVLVHLTGHKRKRAVIIDALVNSRLGKTRNDRYDDYELGLVDQIQQIDLSAGTSTTVREAVERLKNQSVLWRESERERRRASPPSLQS